MSDAETRPTTVKLARLTPAARERLARLAAGEAILRAPDRASAGLLGAGFLLCLIGGGAFLLVALGAGVVDSGDGARPLLAALAWGAIAAAAWWTLAGAARDLAQLRGGVPGGTYILPLGAMAVKSGWLQVIDAHRIERWELRAGPVGRSGLALLHIDVVAAGGARIGTVLFGTHDNVPSARLDALVARGRELRERGERGEALVADEPLAAARSRRRGPPRRRRASATAGIAVGAASWLLVLPWLSVRGARASGRAAVWESVAASHPLPWIRGEADRAVALHLARARDAILARLAHPWDERLAPLIDAGLAARRIVIRVLPPGPAEIDAASERLRALAPSGTQAAPILLHHVGLLGATTDPAALPFAASLPEALGLDVDAVGGALEIAAERYEIGAPIPDVPRIEVPFTIAADNALRGQGSRVFAGLAFTFAPRAVVPGAPPVALGEPIAVRAPTSFDTVRFDMGSLRDRPLDSTGFYAIDAIEDAQIYLEMAERAAARAGDELAARLTR